MLRFGRSLFTKYTTLLETRPLLTKGATSATLMGIGDIVSQKGTPSSPPLPTHTLPHLQKP